MKNKMIGYETAYSCIRLYYQKNFPYPVKASMADVLQILVKKHLIQGEVTRISPNSHLYKLTISKPTLKPTVMSTVEDRFRAELEEYLSTDDGIRNVVADIMQLHSWLQNNGFIDESGVATEKMLSQSAI